MTGGTGRLWRERSGKFRGRLQSAPAELLRNLAERFRLDQTLKKLKQRGDASGFEECRYAPRLFTK